MAKPRIHASGGPVQGEPLQLAAETLPTRVGDEAGGWTRPVLAVAVGAESTFCYAIDVGGAADSPFDLAGRTLDKVLAGWAPGGAGAPPTVRVRDPELATALRARPAFAGVTFDVVAELHALDPLLAQLREDLLPPAIPPLLEQPGMSVERLSAFADGAAQFHASRPWRELHDDDLIEVHAPRPPKGMRCASVLGAGGEVIGLGFFPTLKAHEKLVSSDDPLSVHGSSRSPRWSLMFHGPDELPPEDAEAWERHGLRTSAAAKSGEDSVPVLLQYRGEKFDRPDPATLTFVEGLCRAVAAATPAEFDAGRWEATVPTFDGPVTYRLTIPHLLAPPPPPPARGRSAGPFGQPDMERAMRDIARLIERSGATSMEEANAILEAQVNRKGGVPPGPAEPLSDAERAIDLCYEAQGHPSRRALQMIREALRLDPDCAEAYVLLARRHADPAEAEALFRQGIEAGRRALGEEAFSVPGYPFWGATESRPFMRAMAGLCDVLEAQDRREDAAATMAEMLRLNPGDNQGMRYRYVALLIKLGRLDAARALIESPHYRDDVFALWDYSAALIAFKQARRAEATGMLTRAVEGNPWVPSLILSPERMPPAPPSSWSPGTPGEAVEVASLLGEVWRSDAGALDWLGAAEGTAGAAASARLKAKQRFDRQRGRQQKRKRRR